MTTDFFKKPKKGYNKLAKVDIIRIIQLRSK